MIWNLEHILPILMIMIEWHKLMLNVTNGSNQYIQVFS